MSEARRAGWQFLVYVLLLAPFALAFDWVSRVLVWPWPVFPWLTRLFFWVVLVLMVVCLFYSVWGLICGYSPKAWNDYSRNVDRQIMTGAKSYLEHTHPERK